MWIPGIWSRGRSESLRLLIAIGGECTLNRIFVALASGLGAALLTACSGGGQSVVTVTATPSSAAAASDASTPALAESESEASPTSEAPSPSPEPTEEELDVIESGTWIVPDEIKPGYYRVAGYWATMDEDMEIMDNDGVYEDDELTLAYVPKSAAYVEISGEAVSIEEFPSYPVMELLPRAGTYLVGPDIKPGQYRVSDKDYAYAARLDKDLEIIDNDGNEGSVIINIEEGDFAFSFSGEIKELK